MERPLDNDMKDAMESASLPAARVAEIGAHVDYFGSTNEVEVVDRLGHRMDEWRQARDAIADALSLPRRARDAELVRTFSVAFAGTLERLEAEAPKMEALGPRRSIDASFLHPSGPQGATPHAPEVRSLEPLLHEMLYEEASTEDAPIAPLAKPSYLLGSVGQRPHGPEEGSTPAIAAVLEPERQPPSRVHVSTPREVSSRAVSAPDETAPIPVPGGARVAPLPFRPSALGYAIPTARVDSFEPDSGDGDTAFLVLDTLPASTPFVSSLAKSHDVDPPVSLEAYAVILAELAASPGSTESIWRRHGMISEESRRALESAFRARFDRVPEERARLAELIKRHRALLHAR